MKKSKKKSKGNVKKSQSESKTTNVENTTSTDRMAEGKQKRNVNRPAEINTFPKSQSAKMQRVYVERGQNML